MSSLTLRRAAVEAATGQIQGISCLSRRGSDKGAEGTVLPRCSRPRVNPDLFPICQVTLGAAL